MHVQKLREQGTLGKLLQIRKMTAIFDGSGPYISSVTGVQNVASVILIVHNSVFVYQHDLCSDINC